MKRSILCDYPYGFGLSYTTTELSDIRLESADGANAAASAIEYLNSING